MKKTFLLILAIHLIASGLSFTLVTFRIVHVGRPHFVFLLWNLFLALAALSFCHGRFQTAAQAWANGRFLGTLAPLFAQCSLPHHRLHPPSI